MGAVLALVGLGMIGVGGLMIALAAFRAGILWGLGSLLVPLVGLLFVVTHWDDTRGWFFLQVFGVIAYVGGIALGPGTAESLGIPTLVGIPV